MPIERQRLAVELDVAYVASHDLQEPLRRLVAFCGLLRRDLQDAEKASRDLHFIEESASSMQKLVDDLLELSRTGRSDLKRELISLEACAGDAIDALQIAIERTGAEIECDALPEQRADPRLLTQLYQNLIGNALKFSGGQRPKIHLTSKCEGGRWIFGVKDNGIGIQPQYAGQIYGVSAAPRAGRVRGIGNRIGHLPQDGRAARRRNLGRVGARRGISFSVLPGIAATRKRSRGESKSPVSS